MICDSQTSYPLKLDFYKGKEPNKQITSSLGTIVVLNLSDSYKNSGRNITYDKFFTSPQLGQKLLQRKLTLVITIRKIEPNFRLLLWWHKVECISVTCIAFKEMQQLLPIAQRKKTVTLLSTMHNDKSIKSSSGNKPEIIQYY